MNVFEMKSYRWEGTRHDIANMRKLWGWFLAEGIVLTFFGLVAVSTAVLTTLASVSFLGLLLLLGGAMTIVRSFFSGSWGGFFLELFGGLLYTVPGLLMVTYPAMTAVSLTFLLAPLFMVGGLFRLINAVIDKYAHWGWAATSGAITFLAGLMIWSQMPSSGLWVIGTLVGVEIFFRGIALTSFALALRSLPKAITEVRRAA